MPSVSRPGPSSARHRRHQGEHDEFISEEQPAPNVRDIFLTGSGSRAEHYEIAAYTGLVSLARGLGERECVRLLSKNLREERAALAALTAVGKRLVGAGEADREPSEHVR